MTKKLDCKYEDALRALEAAPRDPAAKARVEKLMIERVDQIIRHDMRPPLSPPIAHLFRCAGGLMWLQRLARAHGLPLLEVSEAVRLIEGHPDFARWPSWNTARQYAEMQGAGGEAALWT